MTELREIPKEETQGEIREQPEDQGRHELHPEPTLNIPMITDYPEVKLKEKEDTREFKLRSNTKTRRWR